MDLSLNEESIKHLQNFCILMVISTFLLGSFSFFQSLASDFWSMYPSKTRGQKAPEAPMKSAARVPISPFHVPVEK